MQTLEFGGGLMTGNYSAANIHAGRFGDWWKADWMPFRIFRSFLRSVET